MPFIYKNITDKSQIIAVVSGDKTSVSHMSIAPGSTLELDACIDAYVPHILARIDAMGNDISHLVLDAKEKAKAEVLKAEEETKAALLKAEEEARAIEEKLLAEAKEAALKAEEEAKKLLSAVEEEGKSLLVAAEEEVEKISVGKKNKKNA